PRTCRTPRSQRAPRRGAPGRSDPPADRTACPPLSARLSWTDRSRPRDGPRAPTCSSTPPGGEIRNRRKRHEGPRYVTQGECPARALFDDGALNSTDLATRCGGSAAHEPRRSRPPARTERHAPSRNPLSHRNLTFRYRRVPAEFIETIREYDPDGRH